VWRHILLGYGLFILQGEAQQRVRASQPQLATDIGAAVFYGSVVDGKLRSDFLARLVAAGLYRTAVAGGNQLHNLALGPSEPVRQRILWRGEWLPSQEAINCCARGSPRLYPRLEILASRHSSR
jgi:hypothetical protein